MSEIKILELNLRNFKGIKDFTLSPEGKNVNVYGDNATGKTTIMDAFMWLLFDKDSQNKKDFEIKTLDKNNQAINGLDHEVEGTFEVNNEDLTLRKVYGEKWTKKRGDAQKTFTGHTTDYYIDDVPVKKKEYEEKIASIVDEDIFKLLTNPTHFNEQLHWEERRKILIEICGDISDSEVIKSDKALTKLPEILQGRSIEDHRKVIAAKRAKINKELEMIPVRIDEAQKALPDISDVNTIQLQKNITDLKEKLSAKQQELIRIETGGEIAEKQKQLRELEGELLKQQNDQQKKMQDATAEKRNVINQVNERIFELENTIKKHQTTIKTNEIEIQKLDQEMGKLRDTWYEVNNMNYDQDDTCPTCGQKIPQSKLQETIAEFNYRKAERLGIITADGTGLKAKKDELIFNNESLQKQIMAARDKLFDEEKAVKALEKDIADLHLAKEDPSEIVEITEKINALEKEIASLRVGNQDSITKVKDNISELSKQLESLEQTKASVAQYDQGQKRIKELEQRERALAKEFENLEGQIYLTEQFIKKKVELLEEKINSKFKLARFKLFDVQVNGAIVECCETLYHGVPYSSMNNAARINVGLDIINTLSKEYCFSAPIFIDNREAITKLVETNDQVISLIVSEQDKKLRVEVL